MTKQLLKRIREYRWVAVLTPILVSIEVILEVALPYVIANLIDYGVNQGDLKLISYYGFELIMVAVLALVFGIASSLSAAKAGTGLAQNLRHDIFYKIQDYSFGNIDKFTTGGIITRITTDVSYVRMAFQMIMRIAVRAPLMMIFALIISIKIHPRISFIYLAIMPLLAIPIFIIVIKAKKYFEKVFKSYDQMNNVVQENIDGIRVVKAFVQEGKEKTKFKKIAQKVYDYNLKAEKILALNGPIMHFFMRASTIIIAWVGAHLIIQNQMTIGQLMSLFTYSFQILASLMMFSIIFVIITISIPAGKRIVELLEEQPLIKNITYPVKKVLSGDIVFEDVYFSYVNQDDKLVLTNLNFEIKSGQTIGIIGPTGAGKTALIQLILRLYDTTHGNVYVGGVKVQDYDLKTLRHNISCVLQNSTLFSGTIKENLRWGNPKATLKEMITACKLAQAHDFIMKFKAKYNAKIEQGGKNISGGQRQRLCIARALLKNPKILILDDATSAVDTRTEAQIRNSLIQDCSLVTKIIISQRVLAVAEADQIIVLNQGVINGIGTHNQLLKNNKMYREIYISQQKGATQ